MSRRLGVKADQIRKWFGRPQSLSNLNLALRELHDRLLPKSVYNFDSDADVRYEELLHELSHHATLDRSQWNTPRDHAVGVAIAALTPASREGNEIDALALSILLSEFLQRPISLRYVDLAVRTENLKYMNIKQARQMVRASIDEHEMYSLGYALAQEVYSVLHSKGML